MSRWLDNELRQLIDRLPNFPENAKLYLFYKRGSIVIGWPPFDQLEGYAQASLLSIPRKKSREDLLDWLRWELKSVPCFPGVSF